MTKTRSTKQALLMSVLALVMCLSMLVGSTMAWFTDSVTSTGNKIQAGTLKLDLEMYNTQTQKYESIKTSKAPIFDYDKWEPGYTDVKLLKVENEGTLALKWYAKFVSETELSALADVIDVYVCPSADEIAMPADRDLTGYEKVGTVREFVNTIETTTKGTLEAGKSAYLGIALKMQETAGNDYQDLKIEAFDIVILASQLSYEKDSFDEIYDIEATYINKNADGEYEISTLGELAYFTQSVDRGTTYAGETVVLTADIDLDGVNWMPIGSWGTPFKGTFDGQGHTISNLTINSPEGEEVGLFGCIDGATIKSVNVKNADVLGYQQVAAIAGMPYTGCTISDCHVSGDINIVAEYAYAGGIAGYGYVTIEDCSVIADTVGYITATERNAVGGISAWILEGANGVYGCTVKNLELTAWANIGAITGFAHYSNTVDDCVAENIVINKTRLDGNPTVGLAAGGWSYSAANAITITNNSFKNVTFNGNYVPVSSADLLYGAEYGGNLNSNFVTSGNTQENITNNLVEVTKVTTADELQRALANGGNIVLSADIIVSETTFVLPADKTATLLLNGKTVDGTFDITATANKNLFEIKGVLTIEGEGTITMNTTGINMGWNGMSCTLLVNGGDLTVNNANIINEGGTDMAYAIDGNPWNPASNDVLDIVLNNVKVESTYFGIRVRDNGPYLYKLVANDSDIDEIWYQKYDTNYGYLVEVVLNNTTADTTWVDSSVLTIN